MITWPVSLVTPLPPRPVHSVNVISHCCFHPRWTRTYTEVEHRPARCTYFLHLPYHRLQVCWPSYPLNDSSLNHFPSPGPLPSNLFLKFHLLVFIFLLIFFPHYSWQIGPSQTQNALHWLTLSYFSLHPNPEQKGCSPTRPALALQRRQTH